MNKNGFFKEYWAQIGYFVGLVGAAVTILLISGSFNVEYRWIVVFGIVLIASLWMAIKASLKVKEYSEKLDTAKRYAIIAYKNEDNKDFYYTDFTRSLRVGTIVNIYYYNMINQYSEKVALGEVSNLDTDGYIEVVIFHVYDEQKGRFINSKDPNSKVIDQMYLLPNTYSEDIALISKYLQGRG